MKMHQSISLNRDQTVAFFLILFFCFFANYYDLLHFGFYEDDYTTITPYLGMPLHRVADIWLVLIEKTFERGRPLGNLIPSIAAIVGFNIGGIPGIHFLGALVVFFNGFLAYKIINKSYDRYLALFTGIILVLYPAITVKQYLTHTLQLQSSLLIGLIAIYLYINDRKKISYLIAILSLFTYELGFLPFMFSPLFSSEPNLRKKLKDLLFHLGYCGLIVLLVAGARIYAGDYRFSNPHYLDSTAAISEKSLTKFFKALVIGPLVSLESFLRAIRRVCIWGPRNISIVLFGAVGAITGYFLAIMARLSMCRSKLYWDEKIEINMPISNNSRQVKRIYVNLANALLTGLICLSGAYLFNLPKYPPDSLSTRNVSEHLASTLGGSLLVAGIIYIMLYLTTCLNHRVYGAAVKYLGYLFFAAFFGTLVAFGRYMQLDADNVWTVQRAFWTQFNMLVPDLKKGTRVYLYRDSNTPFANNLQAFSWSTSLIADQLYDMPDEWGEAEPFWYKGNTIRKTKNYPRVLYIRPGWWKSIEFKGATVTVNLGRNTWNSRMNKFENGNLVILNFKNGHLVRRSKDIVTNNGIIHLKKLSRNENKRIFEPGTLYPYLIDPALKNMTFPKFILYLMRDKAHKI